MISFFLSNIILTAEQTSLNGNFQSVIILCGIAGLILLIVAFKLFYDRVIGPKIDELESQDPEDRKKKKKKKNNNNNITETDNNEEAEANPDNIFQYESITDDVNSDPADDNELNDEEIIGVDAIVHGEDAG